MFDVPVTIILLSFIACDGKYHLISLGCRNVVLVVVVEVSKLFHSVLIYSENV